MLLSITSYKKHIEHFHSKGHTCKVCDEAFDALKVFDLKGVFH